jgi:hypothetical protein
MEEEMAYNGYKVMDSDMHVLEPADLWTRYIDPKYRDQALVGTKNYLSDQDLVYQGLVISRFQVQAPFQGGLTEWFTDHYDRLCCCSFCRTIFSFSHQARKRKELRVLALNMKSKRSPTNGSIPTVVSTSTVPIMGASTRLGAPMRQASVTRPSASTATARSPAIGIRPSNPSMPTRDFVPGTLNCLSSRCASRSNRRMRLSISVADRRGRAIVSDQTARSRRASRRTSSIDNTTPAAKK